MLLDVHLGKGEITYTFLCYIYFSSQMFLIRLEVLNLSGSQPNFVQVSRALFVLGVFYSNLEFQWTRRLHQPHLQITFSLSYPPPTTATFPDALSFPTLLAVFKSTTFPINLSAQAAALENFKYRNAFLSVSITTAVTDGACSYLGIVRGPKKKKKPTNKPKTTHPRSPSIRGGFSTRLSAAPSILPLTPTPAVPCAALPAAENGAVAKVFSGSCSSYVSEARRRRSDSAAISCV